MKETRRNFIIKSSLATAGLTTINPISVISGSLEEKVNIGIIGTGDRGQGLASLLRQMEGVEILGMSDVIPFRLEKSMKSYGSSRTKAYPDYRTLLDDKNIDSIIIATPFGMHAEMAIESLDAGKHVYCEKTLTYGFEDVRKLWVKANGSKNIFQTGHQYHSSRLYSHIVQMLEAGYIGEISLVQCQWNRNGDWRRPVPDPKWEKMINWRMYREYSGGLTAELCSHQIDFTNWIMGGPPSKVSGFGGIDYWKDGRETYDNVHILTEYENGVKASYTSLTTNAKDNYQIKVLGKKGSIVITPREAWIYSELIKNDSSKGIVDGVSGATISAWKEGKGAQIDVSHKDPSLQALIDFKESVLQNKKPLSSIETGAQAAIVVQMALNAMDYNKVQFWKDDYAITSKI